MPTPEAKVKAKVKALFKSLNKQLHVGVYAHWPVQTGFGAPTLDCIGCAGGHYFAVETKAPGKALTPRQQLTITEMRLAGAQIFIIGEQETQDSMFPYSGLEDLERWLRGL